MPDPGLVTVVIPVRDGERFVGEALRSVLDQTWRPLEIVVVDDGSQDGTREVVRALGKAVRLVSQPGCGAAAARNRGAESARGDFLAFLDADDLWLPEKLSLQMGVLAEDSAVEAVFGMVEQFEQGADEGREHPHLLFLGKAMSGYHADTLLIRRAAFQRVGPFAIGYRVGEFVEWHARAVEAGLEARLLLEVVARRRIHDSNTSLRQGMEARRDFVHILKSVLDRRRGGE